jgi:hypothetical protein
MRACICCVLSDLAQIVYALPASRKAHQHRIIDKALERANLIDRCPSVFEYFLAAINVNNYVLDFDHIYYHAGDWRRVELVKVAFVLPLAAMLCSGRQFDTRDVVSLDETSKWVWFLCIAKYKVPTAVLVHHVLPFLRLS